LLAELPPAAAEPAWMSQETMRAEFVGKKLRGYVHYGGTWTSSHHEGGGFEACEGPVCVEGGWFFRGRAFCDVRGPPYSPLRELCAVVKKISANCYEFHMTSPLAGPRLDKGDFQPQPRWHSRGWRQEEASTCDVTPSV
jgi:hypothetical protein